MSETQGPVLKHIFESIRIGHLLLRNRIMMAPITTGLEAQGNYDELANFYSQIASGGTGLITIGGFAYSRLGSLTLRQQRFDRKHHVANHRKITDAIHAKGSFALFQLIHYGAEAQHLFAMNASTVSKEDGRRIAWKMPRSIIKKTIGQCIKTALLAKEANYDGVELDACRQRLLNSFATPGLNTRQDDWGETSENRYRLALEIVKGIRQQAGEEFLIGARISLLDFHRFGKSWEETVRFARDLEKVGVNYFTFDFGVDYMPIPTTHGLTPEDAWVPFIEMFRKEVSVPIVFGDNLSTPKLINEILGNNPHTCVELARPLIVDHGWVKKILYRMERNIIECTKCNQGCTVSDVSQGKTIRCMMNPTLFQNQKELFIRTQTPRRILVVGAGPSGLATAVFAARRGHKVTIYEELDEIGGQVLFCSKIPGKTQFTNLIKLLKRLCDRFDVEIETGHRVSFEEFEEIRLNFDEVVFATGSRPSWIDIQGVPPSKIYQYPDIFVNPHLPIGKRVAVLGSNRIAIDTAIYLVHKDNPQLNRDEWLKSWGVGDPTKHIAGVVGVIPQVQVPSRQVSLLTRTNRSYNDNLLQDYKMFENRWLRIMGIKSYTNVNYETYESAALRITTGKHHTDEQSVYADHIVICSMPQANNSIAEIFKNSGFTCHVVGAAKHNDNTKIKSILECLRDGIALGAKL